MRFFIASPNILTPFSDPETIEIFSRFNYFMTSDVIEADCIVASTFNKLVPFLIRYPFKKYLVWTNEPRYSTTSVKAFKLPGGLAHINYMNVFTNDVFWNNRHFLGTYHFYTSNNLGMNLNEFINHLSLSEFKSLNKTNKIAAFFTNKLDSKTKLLKGGVDIDLLKMRCEYALKGHEKNILDIYGNGWAPGISVDNSGYGFEKKLPWWLQKIENLKSYKFNFCPENTAYKYYTSEKIWHAIKAYSLPIYNSFNTAIYETFPKNSFIDIADFKNADDLFEFALNMDDVKYLERLNLCIDVYNREQIIKKEYIKKEQEEFVKKIVERIS